MNNTTTFPSKYKAPFTIQIPNLPSSIETNKDDSTNVISLPPHVDNTTRSLLNIWKPYPNGDVWDKNEILYHPLVDTFDKEKGSHPPTDVAWNETKQSDTSRADVLHKITHHPHSAETKTSPRITTMNSVKQVQSIAIYLSIPMIVQSSSLMATKTH